MTFHDSVLVRTQDSPSSPRQRRPVPTDSMRSRSARSPSPIVTFTPTPLLSDTKGVKNITRTVIRTLEGLGHLDSANMEERHRAKPDETNNPTQLEQVFNNNAHQRNLHAHDTANGTVLIPDDRSRTRANETPRKIDFEIPRKLLHSSIGRYLLTMSPEPLQNLRQDSSQSTFTSQKAISELSCLFFGQHSLLSFPLTFYDCDTHISNGYSKNLWVSLCVKAKRFGDPSPIISAFHPLTLSEIIQWRHLVYPWSQFCPYVLST